MAEQLDSQPSRVPPKSIPTLGTDDILPLVICRYNERCRETWVRQPIAQDEVLALLVSTTDPTIRVHVQVTT